MLFCCVLCGRLAFDYFCQFPLLNRTIRKRRYSSNGVLPLHVQTKKLYSVRRPSRFNQDCSEVCSSLQQQAAAADSAASAVAAAVAAAATLAAADSSPSSDVFRAMNLNEVISLGEMSWFISKQQVHSLLIYCRTYPRINPKIMADCNPATRIMATYFQIVVSLSGFSSMAKSKLWTYANECFINVKNSCRKKNMK
jgi:hypothetical protein